MQKGKAKSATNNMEQIDREQIEKLAYENWLKRGCPDGSAEQDWIEAEKMLLAAPEPVEIPSQSLGKSARKTGSAMRAAG